jgi:hypothetical protein
MRRTALPAALLALSALAAPARAVDVNEGQLTIHGDGQWAYQRTSGQNAFDEATPAGNYDTAMFDLVLTARPAENLVISAQLGFDPDGSGLEWGFAEWRYSELLRLRMGKVQQPFGNLNELRFAGTTRPFFHLPYSVYGPANVVGTAYLGAGATGQLASDSGWTLAYDLYLGAAKLSEAEPYAAIKRTAGEDLSQPVEVERYQVRDLVGGRLSLTTPQEVVVRLSGFAGQLLHGTPATGTSSERFNALGGSVQYRGEQLWLSAEAFRSQEGDGEVAWTSYATAGWMLTEHLQVSAQWEWARTVFDGSPRSTLLRHQSNGLGLAWWVNPSLVFKANWQRVDGNRFAFPEGVSPAALAGFGSPTLAVGEVTDVITLGTQFAF